MERRITEYLAPYQLPEPIGVTMYNEYYYLLYMGGIFMCLETKLFIFSIVQVITYVTIVFGNTLCVVVSCFKAPSIISLAQYLNYLSLSIINLGIILGMLANRARLIYMWKIMSEDFYDYGETLDSQKVTEWKKRLKHFKMIVLFVIPTYLGMVGFSIMFRQGIDMIFGFETSDEDYDEGGIYQKTPIRLWYPFKIQGTFRILIVWSTQLMSGGIHAIGIGAADVLMLFMSATLNLQMKILCTAASKMDERARNMYIAESCFNEYPEDPVDRSADPIVNLCYKRAIKQVIQHHHIICDFFDNFYTLIKWPAAMVITSGSLMIAMSILALMMGSGEAPSTIVNAVMLFLGEVGSIIMVCEMGHQISMTSQELIDAMYEFDWMDLSASNKRMLMIFQENSRKPLVLKAGGLTQINRYTLATIMNTTYSYINLLYMR